MTQEITSYFGTDGARGKYGEGVITEQGAYHLGLSAVANLASEEPFFIGHDTRPSSPALAKAMAHGVADGGREAVLIGVIPTPGLAQVTQSEGALGGMVTASHNPAQDNGFKLFAQGRKISDLAQQLINYDLNYPDGLQRRTGGHVYTDHNRSHAMRYEDFVVGTVPEGLFNDMSVLLDTANGAASGFAARIFGRLGAKVTALFDQPGDGSSINKDCGATSLHAVQQAIRAGEFDLGVAYDGDADRNILIGSDGTAYTGDDTLNILCRHYREKGGVGTIMTNTGLVRSLGAAGITIHKANAGDRYVRQEMDRLHLRIGAEPSGHVIIDNFSPTGDGPLASVQVARVLVESGGSLADWAALWQRYPQEQVNVPAYRKLADHPAIKALTEEVRRSLGEHGQVNVRPSGTEELIRVMVEGPDQQTVARHITTLTTRIAALSAA